MNYIRGTVEHPIWVGDYRKDDLILQNCKKQTAGETSSTAQESYVMVDGLPTHPYSSLICSTKALFLLAMEQKGITNPNEELIED